MEQTFQTTGAVRLEVHNATGRVSLLGGDAQATTVSISAVGADAESLAEHTEVTHVERDGVHQIGVRVPNKQGHRNWFVRSGVLVEVRLPQDAEVSIATASADIDIAGRFATGRLTSASGDIRAERFTGSLVVRTASGDVRLGESGAELRVDTVSGDLQLDSAIGPVHLRSVSGDVCIGSALAGLAAQSVSGDVRIACVTAGRVETQSASGDVTVGIAEGASLHVDAQSVSGEMHSEIPLGGDEPSQPSGPRVEVAARTISGDVRVLRASNAASPANPLSPAG